MWIVDSPYDGNHTYMLYHSPLALRGIVFVIFLDARVSSDLLVDAVYVILRVDAIHMVCTVPGTRILFVVGLRTGRSIMYSE